MDVLDSVHDAHDGGVTDAIAAAKPLGRRSFSGGPSRQGSGASAPTVAASTVCPHLPSRSWSCCIGSHNAGFLLTRSGLSGGASDYLRISSVPASLSGIPPSDQHWRSPLAHCFYLISSVEQIAQHGMCMRTQRECHSGFLQGRCASRLSAPTRADGGRREHRLLDHSPACRWSACCTVPRFKRLQQYFIVSSVVGMRRLSEAPKVGVCKPDSLPGSLLPNKK